MTKTLKLPAGLRRKDVTKFWVDCNDRDRWCVLKSIGDGEPVQVTPRYASAVNAWAQLIGRERAMSMDEATARKLLFRSDIGQVKDLRRREVGGTIVGSSPSRSTRHLAKKRRKLTAAERKTIEGRFALHLRALMDGRGWQVGELHKQFELFAPGAVDKPAIQAWLRGESLPKAKLLEPLGKALGLKDYREVLPPPTE